MFNIQEYWVWMKSMSYNSEFDLFVLMLFEGHLSYSVWSVVVCALVSSELLGQCNLHQTYNVGPVGEIVNSTPPPPPQTSRGHTIWVKCVKLIRQIEYIVIISNQIAKVLHFLTFQGKGMWSYWSYSENACFLLNSWAYISLPNCWLWWL